MSTQAFTSDLISIGGQASLNSSVTPSQAVGDTSCQSWWNATGGAYLDSAGAHLPTGYSQIAKTGLTIPTGQYCVIYFTGIHLQFLIKDGSGNNIVLQVDTGGLSTQTIVLPSPTIANPTNCSITIAGTSSSSACSFFSVLSFASAPTVTITRTSGDDFTGLLAGQSLSLNGISGSISSVTNPNVLIWSGYYSGPSPYTFSAQVKGCQSIQLASQNLYRGACNYTGLSGLILRGISSPSMIFFVGQSFTLNYSYSDVTKAVKTLDGNVKWGGPVGSVVCTVTAIGASSITVSVAPYTYQVAFTEDTTHSVWSITNVSADYAANPGNYNGMPYQYGAGSNFNYLISAGAKYAPYVIANISTGSVMANPIDLANDGTYYNFHTDNCGANLHLTALWGVINDLGHDIFDTIANNGAGPTVTLTYPTPPDSTKIRICYVDNSGTFQTFDISKPIKGYETTITLPIDFNVGADGTRIPYDSGPTGAYDVRQCKADFYLTDTDQAALMALFSDTEARSRDIILWLCQGSGFFPFGADMGDGGAFTCSAQVLTLGGIGAAPYKHFKNTLLFTMSGTPPAYSIPADETLAGPVTIGTVANLKFPDVWFQPDTSIRNYTSILNGGKAAYLNRGQQGDDYDTTFELRMRNARCARLLQYLTLTGRSVAYISMPFIVPNDCYAFGKLQKTGGTFQAQCIQNQFIIKHVGFQQFNMSLHLMYISG